MVPEKGAGPRRCPTAPPPHSGYLWSLGKARIKYATHRITVSKTAEITSWVTFGFSVILSCL